MNNVNNILDILNKMSKNITINHMENLPTEWTVKNERAGNVTTCVINKEEDINE